MSRISRLRPDELTDDQRRVYESIAGGRRAAGPQLFPLTDAEGGLVGPFNPMLLSPTIGYALQELGAAIRYGGALSARSREIAILVVAAHWDCAFERRAHEAVGAHVGLTEAELAALRTQEEVHLDDAEEAAVLALARRLVRRADLDDAAYADAERTLGPAKLYELTVLVGYYATLALTMRVFAID